MGEQNSELTVGLVTIDRDQKADDLEDDPMTKTKIKREDYGLYVFLESIAEENEFAASLLDWYDEWGGWTERQRATALATRTRRIAYLKKVKRYQRHDRFRRTARGKAWSAARKADDHSDGDDRCTTTDLQ